MTRITQRRGTAAQWASANPILFSGEIGYETDTGRFKIGDGTTAWSALGYGAASADHTHTGADIGGTGKSATTFLRGDNTWVTPPNSTYSTASQTEIENAASTTGRLISGQRMWQGVLKHMGTRSVTDWNDAVQNGWHMGFNVPNQPVAGATWFMGTVVAHNSLYVTQTVHAFTADTPANTNAWRRSSTDGGSGVRTWGAWYKIMLSQEEQDARYAQTSHTHGAATASAAGFMPAADKDKLDKATINAWADTLALRDAGARINIGDPVTDDHAATKRYVDKNIPTSAIHAMSSSYGIPTNGTSNAGPAIQAMLNAAPVGATVHFDQSTTLNITTAFTIPKKLTLIGGIFKANPTGSTIIIDADDVTLKDGRIFGTSGAAAVTTTQRFITTTGSPTKSIYGLHIDNYELLESQYANMWLHNVEDFTIENCTIERYQYTGITLLSPKRGTVRKNFIKTVYMDAPLVNAYGIAVTDETNTVAGQAESVLVEDNYVDGVLNWEGIDCHGGIDLKFIGNTVKNCRSPISLVTGNSSRIVAPKYAVVVGNYMERGNAPDTAWGITLAGQSATVGDLAHATIGHNIIRGYTQDISLGKYDPALTTVSPQSTDATNRKSPTHGPFREWSERATIPLNGTAAPTVTVTFPPGHFTDTPSIQLTKQSGSGAAYIPFVSTVSATQAVIGLYTPGTPLSTGTAALSVEAKQANSTSSYGHNLP